ncbi:MAG: hypothetical protein EBZ20_06195 [Rhodobacteraceae bacterium]|nr:hypothetical protein [Paracoccaceae bacterium]
MKRTEFLSKTLKFKRSPNILDMGANPLDKPLYTDLIDALVEQDLKGQNKILHPVVDRVTFARGLAKGMVGRTGMLGQNKTELRALSSSELDQLADFAPDELRNHLRAFEG